MNLRRKYIIKISNLERIIIRRTIMGFELDFLHYLEGFHSPVLDRIMLFITRLGDSSFVWFLICGILILVPPTKMLIIKGNASEYECEIIKRRKVGWGILVACFISMIVVDYLLKGLASRPRPFYVDRTLFVDTEKIGVTRPAMTSFPSGHTAAAFASSMLIFFSYKKAGILALMLACLIAFSRMYFYLHYPTDILGGIVVGVIIAIFANIFGEKIVR